MSTLKQPAGRDRRRYPRYPFTCVVRARELSVLGLSRQKKGVVRGWIQNVSKGGLCILTNQALDAANLVRCEISLFKIPVAIPVVLRVRWVDKNPEGRGYRIGAQFLT